MINIINLTLPVILNYMIDGIKVKNFPDKAKPSVRRVRKAAGLKKRGDVRLWRMPKDIW